MIVLVLDVSQGAFSSWNIQFLTWMEKLHVAGLVLLKTVLKRNCAWTLLSDSEYNVSQMQEGSKSFFLPLCTIRTAVTTAARRENKAPLSTSSHLKKSCCFNISHVHSPCQYLETSNKSNSEGLESCSVQLRHNFLDEFRNKRQLEPNAAWFF